MKICRRCGDGITEPGHHSQVYCLQLKSAPCGYCGVDISYTCSSRVKLFCSKSCASKHMRHPNESRTVICLECDGPFHPRIGGAVYCGATKSAACLQCRSSFEYICAKGRRQFCSDSCRATHTRANIYRLRSVICGICREEFSPNSSKQLYCSSHDEICEFCGDTFQCPPQKSATEGLGRFCSNTCSTLSQSGSKIRNMADYRSMDEWALCFAQDRGRKPGRMDRMQHFGTPTLPKSADRSLHSSRRGSNLEAIVAEELEAHGLSAVANSYPLREEDGSRRQIDLLVESIGLAIEVQDFMSHHATSDEEPFAYGGYKNGPSYHERKRTLAECFGFSYLEIWEDAIMDGSYKLQITEAIAAAKQRISN